MKSSEVRVLITLEFSYGSYLQFFSYKTALVYLFNKFENILLGSIEKSQLSSCVSDIEINVLIKI